MTGHESNDAPPLSLRGDPSGFDQFFRAEYRSVLGLARNDEVAYEGHAEGRPISAMTYDFMDRRLPEFERFGQALLTVNEPGVIRGWHWHTHQTDAIVVISGRALLPLYDGRSGSPTFGTLEQHVADAFALAALGMAFVVAKLRPT